MKVLIFYGDSDGVATPEMREIMNKSTFPTNRTGEIISFILERAVKPENSESFEYARQHLKNHVNSIVNYLCGYLCWNENKGCPSAFTIKDVDTSRPWTIEEYDGAELIKYLDYEVVNQSMNYCEYIE